MILSSSADGSVFLHTTLIFVMQSKENKITKSDWIFGDGRNKLRVLFSFRRE